jgi:hypothetical protein
MSDEVADYDPQKAAITFEATNAALNMRSISADFVDSTFMDTVSEWRHCEYEAKTNGDVQVRTASWRLHFLSEYTVNNLFRSFKAVYISIQPLLAPLKSQLPNYSKDCRCPHLKLGPMPLVAEKSSDCASMYVKP